MEILKMIMGVNKGNEERKQGKKMEIFPSKIERDMLKPGDHIYSWRAAAAHLYAHHGIYVGDGMVIHFTRGAGREIGSGTVLDRFILGSSSSHPSDHPCPKCGYQSRLDGVISSCIDCFLSGGDLCRFEYGVSPPFFLATLGGTCTLAKSDSPEDVLHRASFLLQNGFGCYNIFKKNCVDFAIYCKTGLLVVGPIGQAASFVPASAVFFGPMMYTATRLISDIGVRRDVSKIPVEQLVARSRSNE